MTKNIAEAQSRAIKNKSNLWLDYLRNLAEELNPIDTFSLLRVASLWASTFSCIEWLIVFKLYKTFPDKNEIAEVLKTSWGWDNEVGKIFWTAGRHPVAHVGQANSFMEFDGLLTNVSFDSQNRWTIAVTGEWDKYHPYKAVAVLPPLDDGQQKIQIITFFHQMILAELLPRLVNDVVIQIASENSTSNLQKITELNKQILH